MALRDSVRSVLRYCASPSAARIGLAALRDRRIIERSPLFDADWYMRENPDARRAGAIPAMHYLTAGFRAGLDPSPDFCGREYAALHGLAPVPESQIIGGADGPTSVFVSVRVYPAELAILALVLVLAVAGIATSKKDP